MNDSKQMHALKDSEPAAAGKPEQQKRPPQWAGPLLILVTVFFWMGTYTYPALLTPYLKTLSVSLSMSGYIVASYGFTQLVLRFPLGLWSDKIGKRKIFIIAGLIAVALSSLGLFLTKSPWLILLFRALAGVAAAFWVQISSLYINYYAAEGESTEAVSRLNFMQNLAIILATFFGSRIADRRGIEASFALGAVLGFIGLALAFFIYEKQDEEAGEKRPAEQKPSEKKAFSVTEPNLFWASILAIITQIVSFGIIQGFAPRYAAELGAGTEWIGNMATLSHIAKAVGILLCGQFLIRRVSPRKQLLASLVITALLLFLMPQLSLPWLIPQQMLLNASLGVQMMFYMDQATSKAGPETRSTAMGFFQAVYSVGLMLGPIIVGKMAERFDFKSSFITLGVLTLAALVLALLKLPAREWEGR